MPSNQHNTVVRSDRDFADAMVEKTRRQQETLQLYRAMPTQVPFHITTASEKLARGGNRSGKTGCCVAEVASAAMGIPLHGPNGEELPFLYPKNRPLLIWAIGYDENHIGRMYHKLFGKRMFKVIRDRDTKQVRMWRPWETDDAAREDEVEMAEPLIPERAIAGWGWEKKAEKVFTVCHLHNGTDIYAFTSGGEAATGDAVDIIWIDEDIKYPNYIAEWQARLSDNRGKLLWSSWPRTANRALKEMSDRAKDQRHSENPDVFEICLKFSDNPYEPADEKRKRLAGWNPVERRARDLGEFVTDTILIFPSFNIEIHGLPSKVEPKDKLEQVLAKHNWRVPLNWTNYLTLDPGHAHLAVLLCSVPPPEIGDYIVVWAEICTPHLNADQIAMEVQRLGANRIWQAFYIDKSGGQRTVEGLGDDIRMIYTRAFKRHELKSVTTGHSFLFGSNDVQARNMMTRNCLSPRAGIGPKLRLIDGATPETQKEFGLYKKRVTRDDIQDKVVSRDDHAMDAIGYLISGNPVYVPLPNDGLMISPQLRAMEAFKKQFNPKPTESVFMGPGAAPTFMAHV